MKKNLKIIILILGLALVGIFIYYFINRTKIEKIIPENSIVGCYVGHLQKDVFALKILSEKDGAFDGRLDINNAEKDSSTGTLKGTFEDDILLADYTFQSEGTESVNQVIFKKIGNDFFRGYGKPDDVTKTRFVDLSKITYDTSVPYVIVSENECPIPSTAVQPNITLVDGRQCYAFSHVSTSTEPYTSNEFLDININGTKVTGTKTGNQKGPDLTNGYTGKIVGTLNQNIITDVYSYVVEGSAGKEKEIYQTGKTGIEKLRYPLIEEKGTLVPDLTKPFQILSFPRVECTGSN